ncbi:MAG: hypothetical protein ABIP20_18275 [Chthoniobacteraceae bacterium]
MKSPARRFTLVMVAMSAVSVIGAALLNYFIDPFDRLGRNRLGVYVMAEREVKASEVSRFPHNALYVGNSRMQAIQASRVNGFRFFNGAFPGANTEQVYWFIHHFAHGQELVVLGIDLGQGDPAETEGDIFGNANGAALADHLVNMQTLEASLKTLKAHLAREPSHYLPDGSTYEEDWGNGRRPDNPEVGKVVMKKFKFIMESNASQRAPKLSFLRRIAETLHRRNIPCVLVVLPIHEEVVRHIESLHLQSAFDAWLHEVRAIFPNFIDLSLSPYGAARNHYVTDPIHYKSEAGVRFMNEVVVPFATKVVADHRK